MNRKKWRAKPSRKQIENYLTILEQLKTNNNKNEKGVIKNGK